MAFTIREAFNYFRKAGLTFRTVEEAYNFFVDMGFEITKREFLTYWRQYFDPLAQFRKYTRIKPASFRYLSDSIWYREPEIIPDYVIVKSPIRYEKPYNIIGRIRFVDQLGLEQEKVVTIGFDYIPTTREVSESLAKICDLKREEYMIDFVLDMDVIEIRESALYR